MRKANFFLGKSNENSLDNILGIETLLSKIKDDFYYFNKPKNSVYRASKVQESNDSTLTIDTLCNKVCEIKKLPLYENPRIVPIIVLIGANKNCSTKGDSLGLDEYRKKINNFISTEKVKTAYFLYAEVTEENNKEYSAKHIECFNQLESFNSGTFEPFIDRHKKSLDEISPLLAYLQIGQHIGELKIGNCGHLCAYAASNFLKTYYCVKKSVLNIEVVKVSFLVSGSEEFSHVFLVIGDDQPFDPHNINKEMNNTYFIDPWNFSYVKVSDLFKEENKKDGLSYLRFFVENAKIFQWTTSFSTLDIKNTHSTDKISCIFNAEMKPLKGMKEIQESVQALTNTSNRNTLLV